MAAYREEQEGELEALQAMYSEEELTIKENQKGFSIVITSDEELEEELLSLELDLIYSSQYPDEMPLLMVENVHGLDENEMEEIQRFINESAEECIGTVMGFTLISNIQMKLGEILDKVKSKELEAQKQKEEEERIKEEARFKGTPVTKETFLEWKIKFEVEMSTGSKQATDSIPLKLTGRNMFEKDSSLAKSDTALLDDLDQL